MNLEEAIKHCLDKALNNNCEDCANEHMQLAMWLIELRDRRKEEYKETIRKLEKDLIELGRIYKRSGCRNEKKRI